MTLADRPFPMVQSVFLEVLGEVGPAAADADHDSLSCPTNKANVEFGWRGGAGLVEMVNSDFRVAVRLGIEGGGC